ncbi:MAG TPA: glycosyltransferase [Thermoanaerobaculia bacterium]|nr:glycosyltransferase [Thermoanaerobaculia bacterium]
MTTLRILITNNTLANRAGSELYVRDLATGLRDRGHSPVAFSTLLGEVAEELRLLSIPVIDDLSILQSPPDIIHGQHHMETMTALAHFPGVPAVYVCHGWLPWEETPPIHPRIVRYIAVDNTVRDRLVIEHGIPEDKVDVVLNFVDTGRFQPRSPLPSRPSRALVFSNEASAGSTLDLLRDACNQRGIELDVRGAGVGASLAEPEHILAHYDLVFAQGRSAIEALAVGTAVVLIAPDTLGQMISMDNLSQIRSMNFGLRAIQRPISLELLLNEIDRYHAEDAGSVSREIRKIADVQSAIDSITKIYARVLVEHEKKTPDIADESPAIGNYLRWLSASMKGKVLGLNHTPALRSRVRNLEGELLDLQRSLTASQAEARNFQNAEAHVTSELGTLRGQLEASQARTLESEKAISELDSRLDGLLRENADLTSETKRLTGELARYRTEIAALCAEHEERESTLRKTVDDLTSRLAAAESEKRDWERTLSARIVGLVRRKLWK